MFIIPVNIEHFTRGTGYTHLCARHERARRYTRGNRKTGAKERNTFCVLHPFPKFLHFARKMKPVCLSKTVGNPVCWSTCITTRHVALYRVHPCLASRDMTCQKTNTLYHHHYHGACPSKMTAAVVFPFLHLSSSLIRVHFVFPPCGTYFPLLFPSLASL